MRGKTAGFLFLGICVVLAALLLASSITPLVAGCAFSLALIGLGAVSRGFTRRL